MVSTVPSTPYWQPAYGRAGVAVTGLEEIAQAVSLIVRTPTGSLPGDPAFGCEALDQLDRPITLAIPKMVQAVFKALRAWEPRIDVTRVSATPVALGAVILSVVWAPKGSAEEIGQLILLGSAT
jgi:uncharacterized protein